MRRLTLLFCLILIVFASLPAGDVPDPAEVKRCLEGLKDPDASKRKRAAEYISLLYPPPKEAVEPLAGLLRDSDREVRRAAAQALSLFGTDAQAAVPALIEAIADEDEMVSTMAAVAVQLVGKAAVEPLRKALGHQKAAVRSMAVYVLGQIGEAARPALPDIERLLGDDDQDVQPAAARAFATLGGRSEVAARILCARLGSGGLDDESLVASQGEAALPFLIPLLSDEDPQKRVVACGVVELMKEEGSKAIQDLGKALSDDIQAVRMAAARALGGVGPAAIETLAKGLKDEDAQTRSACAWAFFAMAKAHAKEAQAAIPYLEAVLADPAEQVRQGAQKALEALKKE